MTILKAAEEFIQHCKHEKNLSPLTLKAYLTDLLQLAEFLKKNNHPTSVLLITKKEVRAYLESMSGLKAKSIKRKIATSKALFNFLEFEDWITVNPMRKMRISIREPKVLPKVMDVQEIEMILKLAYEIKQGIPDKMSYSYAEALKNILIIELLYSTGARVSEIAKLKKENVNILTGAITIRGKGNKERIIQVCNSEVLGIMGEYYFLFYDKINSSDYFLINRLGKSISDQSIRNIVKSFASKAGVKKHITPHIFRHSFATLLLERDVDIKYIQSMLGHSSIMTTQIYTHVNREKQIEILKTKHPRRNVSMF